MQRSTWPPLLLSQLLDLHLTRTIKREKAKIEMSKFLELADSIEADLREMDEDADALNTKRLANKERARMIFNDHHTAQDRVAEGLKRMEAVIHDMSGSNTRQRDDDEKKAEAAKLVVVKTETPKLGEGSGATPDNFRPGGEIVTNADVGTIKQVIGEAS